MNEIHVGGNYPPISERGEGAYFEADASGYTLIYNFSKPTEKEVGEMHQGRPFEIKFLVVGSVLWVLSKCGSLSWVEAPFTPHLSHDADKLICPPEGSEGTLLTLLMVDATTNIVSSLRIIGLGNRFSRNLFAAIQEQMNNKTSAIEYFSSVKTIQQKYRTTDLVGMARDRYKIS